MDDCSVRQIESPFEFWENAPIHKILKGKLSLIKLKTFAVTCIASQLPGK